MPPLFVTMANDRVRGLQYFLFRFDMTFMPNETNPIKLKEKCHPNRK